MLPASWYEYLPGSGLSVASAGTGTLKQSKAEEGGRWESLFLESPHCHPPCCSLASRCFVHRPCYALCRRPLLLLLVYLMPDCLLPLAYAAPIQHTCMPTPSPCCTYKHVHSPAVSYCCLSSGSRSTLVPSHPVLAPSLVPTLPVCGHRERQQRSVGRINSSCFNRFSAPPPASGAQMALVPLSSLSRLAPLPSSCLAAVGVLLGLLPGLLSLIRTFYKPGPLPARHMGEAPSSGP